jgi:3-methyl-2-oxobutanoate hydroxymethyltransferase
LYSLTVSECYSSAKASTLAAATSLDETRLAGQQDTHNGGSSRLAITILDVQSYKSAGKRFVMLTAYDYQTAQIFDDVGVPIIFVGDTLGIFALGHQTTIPVTMDVMLHHCQAVSRAVRSALLVGDLPFGSDMVVEDGIRNAVRLIRDGGMHAVKLEGAKVELIRLLTRSGIPVMGHLGLTPQSFNKFGGNKVQARTESAAQLLLQDARSVQEAGAFALVLEAVPIDAASRVTSELRIPTIGIGAGPYCDGQVLVGAEMLGLSGAPSPRFVKRYGQLRQAIGEATRTFIAEVASGDFPGTTYAYDWALKT